MQYTWLPVNTKNASGLANFSLHIIRCEADATHSATYGSRRRTKTRCDHTDMFVGSASCCTWTDSSSAVDIRRTFSKSWLRRLLLEDDDVLAAFCHQKNNTISLTDKVLMRTCNLQISCWMCRYVNYET